MKESLFQIIQRQQRKKISTIINGVHIVPEVLSELALNENIIFINLYISNEAEFMSRFVSRDESKYTLENMQYIFEANKELHYNTLKIQKDCNTAVHSIDITSLRIDETLDLIIDCIAKRIITKS